VGAHTLTPVPTDSPAAQGTESLRSAALARLRGAQSRHTRLRVAYGLAVTASGAIALLVGLIGIESVAYLSPGAKSLVWGAAGITLIVASGGLILRPVLRPISVDALARRIENAHDGLHQHLTNMLQLRPESGNSSSALINAAVRQAATATASIDFTEVCNTGPAIAAFRRLALVTLVGALILQLLPGESGTAFSRLVDAAGHYKRPQETLLSVLPGDTTLIEGDSLVLEVQVGGVVPLSAVLQTQEEGKSTWTSTDIPIREGHAIHQVSRIRRSFVYRWHAHDAETESYAVRARPRPAVLGVETRYRYPAYTGLAERVDLEGGDLVALEGTEVALQIRSSRPLERAGLSFSDSTAIRASVSADTANVVFTIDRERRFTIVLIDTAGISNANPVMYRAVPLSDSEPTVVLLRPGRDAELGERMLVPIHFEAADDFGVARAEIRYRINQDGDQKYLPLKLDAAGNREISQTAAWDLSRSDLLPGDQVYYSIRVYDNNSSTGPGEGETPEFVIRFPSLHEIQEAARREHDKTVDQLESLSEQSERIQEKMKNVAREILKQEEATWEDRAEIRDAVQQQDKLTEEIEKNKIALDKTRQRLEQSGLLTPETLEKLQQVRSLMDDLNTSDLQRISQDLKDAADAADPEMIREALERMASEQEAFQENLDRTIALLERVRNQQTLDALTSRLREMARDQADIHKQIAKQNRLPESLADRQAALKQEAETLQEAIEQAAESIKTPQDRLSELSKSFDRKEIPQRSAQTQRDMRAGQQDRSKTGTKELAEDLDQLATEMEAIRESYRQKQKDELIAQLTGIFNDLLNVSRSQERVASAAEQERNLDADALAQRQTRDLNATTRLAERAHDASKKTFLIPPKAGTGLQNAMSQIQKSVGNLQRGLGRRAAEDAREAMAGLNTAAMAAWEAITAVKGAGSATGLDEMLQQLAEASDRQGELNAETEGMMGKPGDQGEPQGGGFGSLSAEQQAIQQMLDELRQKFGKQEGDALGDLSKISQDMEDIAQRLGRNELNDRTVDRQRRILSRMLDAQRAMRQRGYSNDREAKAGTAFAYRGPGTLPQDLGETSNPLRTRLREALNQRYGEEDQTLIRRYFDRLMEDAASKGTP
jgi:hypothetical protein